MKLVFHIFDIHTFFARCTEGNVETWHWDSSSSPKLKDSRLQQYLWKNETLRIWPLSDGMFDLTRQRCFYISNVIWDPLFTSQISLEHAFHLMINGYIEEAKCQLSITESWRYGKESTAQHQKSKMIQAYRSLLDYVIWCDKKYNLPHTGKMMMIPAH